jgi:hypothetical protein
LVLKVGRLMRIVSHHQSLNHAVREPGHGSRKADRAVGLTGAEKPQFK